jgi:regulator of sigma E protease
MTGTTVSPDSFEKYSNSFSNKRIIVTAVSKGSPAEKAGLKTGDNIISINGNTFSKIEDIQNTINSSAGQAISFAYLGMNSSSSTILSIQPVKGVVADRYAIGIAMSEAVDIKFSFFSAIYEGGRYTFVMIKDTIFGLYDFISQIFKGSANFADVSGPVGIAGIVGGAAKIGFSFLLMITAIISINLGVINLIPFPALDGGRILFVIIESVIRRRLPSKFSNVANAIGFILLMVLMVAVTYKDIVKMFDK